MNGPESGSAGPPLWPSLSNPDLFAYSGDVSQSRVVGLRKEIPLRYLLTPLCGHSPARYLDRLKGADISNHKEFPRDLFCTSVSR
jgi:hypothetical protein